MDGWVAGRTMAFEGALGALTRPQVNAAFTRHVDPRRIHCVQVGDFRAGATSRRQGGR